MFNTLKKLSLALIVTSTAFIQFSCKNSEADPEKMGNWYKKSLPNFEGAARAHAVSFVIGDKGYIGTGITNQLVPRVKDFWSYDTKSRIWSQTAEFGGTGRNNAVAFVLGGKAYVGTGFDGNTALDNGYKKDFWQYDPIADKWKSVAAFPGDNRMYSSAFVVGDKAYVGLGWSGNGYYQDFYSYDAVTDKWATVATFVGGKRRSASAFTINGKAYVGFGTNNTPERTKDIYQFDPAGNAGKGLWTRIDFTQDDLAARTGSLAVVVGEKAYIIGGEGASDVWEFNPTASTMWTQLNPFRVARGYAGGFAVGSTIYLSTGTSGGTLYSDDFWAFDPTAALDEDDDL